MTGRVVSPSAPPTPSRRARAATRTCSAPSSPSAMDASLTVRYISFFLIFYGSIRFIIEFYRQPDSHMGYIAFDTLSMGQILCIPMIIAGFIILVYSKKAA